VAKQRGHAKYKITAPNFNMYDPPDGWKYGFPKPYRPLPGEKITDTLRRDGYPERLMATAEINTRYWHDPTIE
jgi:hypothetical protein